MPFKNRLSLLLVACSLEGEREKREREGRQGRGEEEAGDEKAEGVMNEFPGNRSHWYAYCSEPST